MFKYHERIFDGPEGLLTKRQQAQQQQRMEEMNDTAAQKPIDSKVPLTLVMEKQLPAPPGGQILEPERARRYSFDNGSGNEGQTGYMTHQGDGGSFGDSGHTSGIKRKPVGDQKHGL
jgi:hypothetical protein